MKSLKSEYLTLITHLILDQSHFKCTIAQGAGGSHTGQPGSLRVRQDLVLTGITMGVSIYPGLTYLLPAQVVPGVWVPWRLLWLSRELAGSQQGHVCCGALTLDFDDLAMWGLRVWREDLRAEDVSLKLIPLFICLAVKILGVPAANLLLGGSGALRTRGMGCRSGSPQPPFLRWLLFEPCLSLSVISANG